MLRFRSVLQLPTALRPVRGMGALLVLAAMTACGDAGGEYVIDEVRPLSEPRRSSAHHATSAERFGVRKPQAAAPRGRIGLDLPDGWVEKPAEGMRIVSFGMADHPEVDGSVIQAGGTVGENVNRWRGQVGEDPLDAVALEALPRVPILGKDAVFVQARGPYTGMGTDALLDDAILAGAILELPAVSLFVKVVGPADVLEPRLDEIRAIASSLSFRGDAADDPPPSAAKPQFAWKIPDGWVDNPKGGMRIVNVHPEGHPDAECYLTLLEGQWGGLEENVNRWRGQFGMPALPSTDLDSLPRLPILDREGVLVTADGDFTGMGTTSQGVKSLLGVICDMGDRALFVKMVGPKDVLDAERPRFEAFVASIRENEE